MTKLLVFRVVQPLPAPISASDSIRIPGVSKPCLLHGDNNGHKSCGGDGSFRDRALPLVNAVSENLKACRHVWLKWCFNYEKMAMLYISILYRGSTFPYSVGCSSEQKGHCHLNWSKKCSTQ